MKQAYAYVRLSREEAGGKTEERLQWQADMCRQLAKKHEIDLPEQNIYIERESGGKVTNRPLFSKLLELAGSGLISHIIAQAYDRLTRGSKADESIVENALIDGNVTLVTQTYVQKYSANSDTLTNDLLAAVARAERAKYAQRRRAANDQRIRRNLRTAGQPPYGYTKGDKETIYETVPDQWLVVCDIFKRYLSGATLRGIARYLTAKGIEPPKAQSAWYPSTVKRILTNAIYAGYHTRKTVTTRVGRYVIHPSKLEIETETAGPWETAITLAEWKQIISKTTGNPKYARSRLSLGLLYCPDHKPMVAIGSRQYGCECGKTGGVSYHVSKYKIDGLAVSLLEQLIATLPEDLLIAPKQKTDKTAISKSYASAQKRLSEVQDEIRSLARESENLRRLMGEAQYNKLLEKSTNELTKLTQASEALFADLTRIEIEIIYPLLKEIKEIGFQKFWHSATLTQQRNVLFGALSSITLERKEKNCHQTHAIVHYQKWITDGGWKRNGKVKLQRKQPLP